jgi:pyruvate dehydrogenase E1 component
MPDFWQFPTVSMGLGPMMAIYQARFQRYLEHRGTVPPSDRKVWCFLGDGEMDEPESLGAITMPVREKLDNLVFVINCNLQRLDGPVRGNGKIVQELEAAFLGAGWNVLKVLWGSRWDPLFAEDTRGLLRRLMMECVDGEYQNFKARGGAYTREHFFGKYPELRELVANLSDDDIWRLNRGGHDARKVYNAYLAASTHRDQPTVILAKTVKGYGMGRAGEGQNITHQQKKLDDDALRAFRDRFNIPVSDAEIAQLPYYRPAEGSEELEYLRERRRALGGYLPQRRRVSDEKLAAPPIDAFQAVLEPTAEGREISTTQAFVRSLTQLVRDKAIGPRVVPIIPDEARTFGMEGMFRQLGIYASQGQLYEPVDKDQVMYYREDKAGQILEEGINEAGAMSSWMAAATSYSHTNRISIPFYIFYSMFGFQRIGDLAWAAGDCQARGFLLGATAGRTTLNGEGLQHQDGHSHLMSATIPNCVSYDPTFAHEVAVILQAGLKRMVENQENVWYYVTLMNENYPQPGLKKGQEAGILKGMYRLQEGPAGSGLGRSIPRVQLLGSGTILREAIAAADLLWSDWGVAGDVWSVTSFTELRRDGIDVERWNLLHPADKPRKAYVTQELEKTVGPIVATTDYMRLFADQIRPYIPRGRDYRVLGTDGFGRSDTRAKLREFFEVDRHYVVLSALRALADEGMLPVAKVADAIKKYGIDPNRPNPASV